MNIKPALLLLSLCHVGHAAAIGLGELSVRSHLGQPLDASIAVLDPPVDATTECFRLDATASGIPSLPRTELSLDRRGSRTLLHIRTSQSVHEPILQFVLFAECDTRLQREYVLLLDPLPATPQPAETRAAPALPPPPPVAEPTVQPDARPVVRDKRAPAARVPQPLRARSAPQETPRLVLSGRHMAGEAGAAFALKLDTNLPDLTRPLPEGLTATELSDENTALTRKLAHLEGQLAALQQRNAELEARRARQTARPAPVPPPAPAPQWPLYLLLTGLLGGAVVLVVWLRRRDRPAQSTLDLEDTWIGPDVPPPLPGPRVESQDETALPTLPTAPPPATERLPEMAPATLVENTEVKDDILDQAEVYMAHGHANLAIHLLQEHLRDAPTESPVPWLLLLDLLHREGDTAGYAAASTECRRYFNVNLSDHPVSQDSDNTQGLEAYPHILEQLVHVWKSPNRDDFFKDLIYDHRGGTRMGFRPAAYRDILLLHAIAQDTPLASAA